MRGELLLLLHATPRSADTTAVAEREAAAATTGAAVEEATAAAAAHFAEAEFTQEDLMTMRGELSSTLLKKNYENTQKTLRKHSPRGLHPTSGRAVRLKRGMNPEQTVEQERRNTSKYKE